MAYSRGTVSFLHALDRCQGVELSRVRFISLYCSAGEMADGRAFQGIEDFKEMLLEDPRAIARNMVGQLVTYATGMPVSFADRAAVEKVLDKTAEHHPHKGPGQVLVSLIPQREALIIANSSSSD